MCVRLARESYSRRQWRREKIGEGKSLRLRRKDPGECLIRFQRAVDLSLSPDRGYGRVSPYFSLSSVSDALRTSPTLPFCRVAIYITFHSSHAPRERFAIWKDCNRAVEL